MTRFPAWCKEVYKMKPLAVFLIIISFFIAFIVAADANPVNSYTQKIDNFTVNVVEIDLKDPSITVKPVVADRKSKNKYPKETFSSFIKRTEPIAAINGIYHDTMTYKPTGTIIIDGTVQNIGYVGTAVAFTYSGEIKFYLTDSLKKYYIPWNTFEHVIATGPTLVYGNQLYLNPRGEGFKDPRVLGYAPRSILGLTDDNVLIFATIKSSVSLRRTAQIMLGLKSKYAVCLDGGSSSGLYYNGKYLTYTGRQITNILAVNYNGFKYSGFVQTVYK